MKNWEVGAELLVDLADNLTTMLTDKLNVPEIKAKAVAQEATALIADNWAGSPSIFLWISRREPPRATRKSSKHSPATTSLISFESSTCPNRPSIVSSKKSARSANKK